MLAPNDIELARMSCSSSNCLHRKGKRMVKLLSNLAFGAGKFTAPSMKPLVGGEPTAARGMVRSSPMAPLLLRELKLFDPEIQRSFKAVDRKR